MLPHRWSLKSQAAATCQKLSSEGHEMETSLSTACRRGLELLSFQHKCYSTALYTLRNTVYTATYYILLYNSHELPIMCLLSAKPQGRKACSNCLPQKPRTSELLARQPASAPWQHPAHSKLRRHPAVRCAIVALPNTPHGLASVADFHEIKLHPHSNSLAR